MKKIFFILSVLLLVAQNSFAGEKEDVALAKKFKHQKALHQVLLCENEMNYHANEGKIDVCLKAVKYIQKGYDLGILKNRKKEFIAESYLNAGVIAYSSGDKIKSYQYFIKAAKLGDTQAQKNLDILCKESPWACKQ